MEGTHSKTKNNFILRNRVMTTSRSTQNLNSARSLSTNNSQGIGKGINFNTRSVNKLPKNNM